MSRPESTREQILSLAALYWDFTSLEGREILGKKDFLSIVTTALSLIEGPPDVKDGTVNY